MKNRKYGNVPIRSSIVCAYLFSKKPEGPRHLILKRRNRFMFGIWQQVAGSIEIGERASEAILREII